MPDLSKCFDAAVKSVLQSGGILKKYFSGRFKVKYKGERNPVTIADRKSENAIIKTLSKKFPDIEFLCEESRPSEAIGSTGLVWILDPLDGTVNFLHKLPFFSISLALYNGKEVLFGIVYNPISKDFFSAVKNRGAYLNGKKITVSKIKDVRHSLIVTGFPYDFEKKRRAIIEKFRNFCLSAEGIRRLGSAALDLCYVACGRFEGFWEEGLNPWDVAAGSLILKEAGGTVSDFAGGNTYLFNKIIVGSNSKIHKEMLGIIESNTNKINL